jgi:hypothetical protein
MKKSVSLKSFLDLLNECPQTHPVEEQMAFPPLPNTPDKQTSTAVGDIVSADSTSRSIVVPSAWTRGACGARDARVSPETPSVPDPLPPFCDHVIHEIVSHHNDKQPLTPQTRSSFGLDCFLYAVSGRVVPSQEQFDALDKALYDMALEAPDTLYRALCFETLDELFLASFPWAIFPKKHARDSSRMWGPLNTQRNV